MDFFKRISDLLTPPPGKIAVPPPSSETTELEENPPPVNLGHEVKQLVAAPALDHPQATDAITKLKTIASDTGLYIVASKMRFQLDAMPRSDGNGTLNAKDRAYVLAADFIYQHMNREIRAARSQGQPIGPNIFRGYCNELVGCLLNGRKARRAIELPVLIIDDLLHFSIESAQNRNLYLELAEVMGQSTVELSLAKLDNDERERNRRRQEMKRGDIPSTPPTDPTAQLDNEAVTYAQQVLESLTRLRKELGSLPAVPSAAPGADRNARSAFIKYVNEAIEVADRAGYLAFSAALRTQVGALAQDIDSNMAVTAVHQAAELYETLAEKERALFFTKLRARRLARASELYAHLGESEKAQALKTKLSAH